MLICGEGEAGKLGLGSTQSVFLPCLVPLEAWPILVAAGGNHTVAVAGNHQYICEITMSTTNDRLQQSVEARIELLLTNLEAVTVEKQTRFKEIVPIKIVANNLRKML